MNHRVSKNLRSRAERRCTNVTIGAFIALLLTHGGNASAASLSRSVDVNASASTVWSAIGPFCAIKTWHPVIGTCTTDGKHSPTRTLATKDGKTTFVEPEVARNEAQRFYSYTFKSSPFPVTHYIGTIWVVAKDDHTSTVLWTGTYTPLPGKDAEADAAFAGVYDAGLAAIKAKYAQ